MPITHLTFVFGWLAIIGTPLFAGFFSKDEILWRTYSSPLGSKGLWLIGVVGAAMTAFYMTRLMALTFWGENRVSKNVKVHESPLVMTLPLVVLALLSLVGGWVGIPHLLSGGHIPNIFEGWLENVVRNVGGEGSLLEEWLTMLASVSVAGISAFLAYVLYAKKPNLAAEWARSFRHAHMIIYNKYFIDEIYQWAFVRPIVQTGRGLWAYVDVRVVDRATYLVSDIVKGTSSGLKMMVNGNVQQYALYIVFGILCSLAFIFTR